MKRKIKMKRALLIAASILLLSSCKEVSMEEQISKLYESVNSAEEINARIEKAGTLDQSDLWDYYSYLLAKESGVKLKEISDEYEDILLARAFGKRKKDKESVILTARAEELPACIAAIEILKLYRNSKIRPNHNIRVIFYKDSISIPKEIAAYNILRMNLHCSDTLAKHTFLIHETEPIYRKILDIIPPYLQPYGSYEFSNDSQTALDAVYNYNISKEDIERETAAVASLIHILN